MKEFPDSQGALRVLRHCGSWGKVVYAARTVPPACHLAAMGEFRKALRGALEQVVEDKLTEKSWTLAQLPMMNGGLGLRDPVRHAGAAYLGSVVQSQELCVAIDSHFDITDALNGLHMAETAATVRRGLAEGASLHLEPGICSQKHVSKLLDAAVKRDVVAEASRDPTFVAHVSLCSVPGAGAWLTAPPTPDGRDIDAPLFRVALKRRLRMQLFDGRGCCPCCGDAMDQWGDHALVCSCNGDRTVRHNSIRDIVHEEAADASLRPEREKAGLLPGRPAEDGVQLTSGARRPADVWLPRGTHGDAEALDFAVTSGMRFDAYRRAAGDPATVFADYEAHKRQYKGTEDACRTQGIRFTPMVLEAHGGGWSPTFRGTVDMIARSAANAHHENHAKVSLRIAQRISCSLHRENARAIMRRMADVPGVAAVQGAGWATLRDVGPW